MFKQLSQNARRFLLSTLLFGFYFSVWELFFNLYILSLGFGKDTLGLIRAATPLAALVLGLPLGLLSDRIGRRKSMLIGLVVGFMGMLFEIHLLNPYLIFLFGLVQGAGVMLYRVAQPPFIMAAAKQENQALVFSLNFGLLTMAGMIGNLVAGQIPGLLETGFGLAQGSAASYQWVITGGILIAATSLIPILLLKEPERTPTKNVRRIPLKEMVRKLAQRPFVRQLMLINLIIGFGAAILIPYLNVFFREKFAINDNLLGLIFSLSSLLVFLGSVATPLLVKWTRSRIIPTVVTQGASVVFLFTLGFSPFLWIASISLLLRTVLMQMSSPLVENFAMQVSPPEEQGAISAVRGVGWQMGQAVGIFISGLVQTQFGFAPLFIATGFFYSLAVALTWIFFRPAERQASSAVVL
jgi:MFS family permease